MYPAAQIAPHIAQVKQPVLWLVELTTSAEQFGHRRRVGEEPTIGWSDKVPRNIEFGLIGGNGWKYGGGGML